MKRTTMRCRPGAGDWPWRRRCRPRPIRAMAWTPASRPACCTPDGHRPLAGAAGSRACGAASSATAPCCRRPSWCSWRWALPAPRASCCRRWNSRSPRPCCCSACWRPLRCACRRSGGVIGRRLRLPARPGARTRTGGNGQRRRFHRRQHPDHAGRRRAGRAPAPHAGRSDRRGRLMPACACRLSPGLPAAPGGSAPRPSGAWPARRRTPWRSPPCRRLRRPSRVRVSVTSMIFLP
jgi:hypothetical protein